MHDRAIGQHMKGIKTIKLNKGTGEELRQQIKAYFEATFSIDEKLYESLASDEVFYLRADPLRHPLVFYLGHTAAFYINKLNIGHIIDRRVNPAFESVFAIGVDEMSWDDLNEAHYNWPSIPEVRAYRDQVRALMHELIDRLPGEAPITWNSPWWVIMMGIEHQRIHLETSSVLIRQLPIDKVKQLDFWAICTESGEAPQNSLLQVPGGIICLGRDQNESLYGWDNEFGKAEYEVQPFLASKYLCSNAEFLEFIADGGYQTTEFWTPEGAAWKDFAGAQRPRFWIVENDIYKLRTMASIIGMPWNWPVEVNYLEAKAFCNWKAERTGKAIRLPLEEQWQHLRELHLHTDQPDWAEAPGNINLEFEASSCPVDRHQTGDFFDLIGNVWQWTETPIYGFPGFRIHPCYDDFSTPTFDGRHNLIKGGSWISTGNEALRQSRYAFRRHFYQHAGFRYIQSEAPIQTHDVFYETDPEVCIAADSDWSRDRKLENELSGRLLLALASVMEPGKKGKVLHIGCRTGRGTFELARFYEHVTGIDATARLIRIATQMKEEEFIRYVRKDEGEIMSYVEAKLEDHDLCELKDKVEFWQADISNLNPKFSGYDLVIVEAMLSRTTVPARFLKMIHERLNPGGYLLIADSWDWSEERTSRENWLGGFRKDGEPFGSQEALAAILSERFELIPPVLELPRTEAQSSRTFRIDLLEGSLWRLR